MSPLHAKRAVLWFAALAFLPCRKVTGFLVPLSHRDGGAFVSTQTSCSHPTLAVLRKVAGFLPSSHHDGGVLVSTRTNRSHPTFVGMAPSQVTTSQTKLRADTLDSRIILYDGVCNFCNAWVDILLRVDVNKKFKFAPLQSDIGRKLLVDIGKDADDISSVLLVEPNLKYYEKSAAPLKVVEELGPLAQVVSKTAMTIVPKEIRDSIYDTVAENRYNLMGKRDECRCSDPRFSDRFVS